MLHYLNPNLTLEQCKELDAKSEKNRDRLFNHAFELIEKAKPEHKAELSLQFTKILAMSLPYI